MSVNIKQSSVGFHPNNGTMPLCICMYRKVFSKVCIKLQCDRIFFSGSKHYSLKAVNIHITIEFRFPYSKICQVLSHLLVFWWCKLYTSTMFFLYIKVFFIMLILWFGFKLTFGHTKSMLSTFSGWWFDNWQSKFNKCQISTKVNFRNVWNVFINTLVLTTLHAWVL